MRARHAGLKTEVASEVTSVGDATVRCVLAKNEAFFVGEEYVLTVDGAMGVGGGEATFVVSDAAAATGAIEVRITLTRASADVSVKLYADKAESNHWSSKLLYESISPRLILELLLDRTRRSAASPRRRWATRSPPPTPPPSSRGSSADWSGGKTELLQHLSKHAKLYVGQQYTLRIADSPFATADPLALSTEDWGGRPVPLAVRRIWHKAHVTLHTKQELPIPFGLQMRIKHVGLGVVVARATTGEEERSGTRPSATTASTRGASPMAPARRPRSSPRCWRRGTTSTSTARARRG